MGIGFTFRAVVKDKKFVKQMIRMLGEEKRYGVWQQEDSMGVNLCRLGDIFFEFTPDLDGEIPEQFIKGGCTSSLAGPGLHAAAVRFVEELAVETDLDLEMNDETGYYEERDFERLKSESFYQWLSNMVSVCEERLRAQDEVSSFGLCWDLDQYRPEEVKNSVFTPYGRFSIPKITGWVEHEGIEPFAKEFFIWNEPGRDARFYRNSALGLMWEECRFMPGSRSDEDERVNSEIIDLLEKALRLDRSLPFPAEEYGLLCHLNEKEPKDVSDVPSYVSDYPIGYRRGVIRETLGSVEFAVPGWYISQFDEEDSTYRWYDGKNEDWHSVCMTALIGKSEKPQFKDQIYSGITGPLTTGGNGEVKYRFACAGLQEDEDGGVYTQYIGEVISGFQITLITLSSENEDRGWAEDFFESFEKAMEVNA